MTQEKNVQGDHVQSYETKFVLCIATSDRFVSFNKQVIYNIYLDFIVMIQMHGE